jgi:hypothetical protein
MDWLSLDARRDHWSLKEMQLMWMAFWHWQGAGYGFANLQAVDGPCPLRLDLAMPYILEPYSRFGIVAGLSFIPCWVNYGVPQIQVFACSTPENVLLNCATLEVYTPTLYSSLPQLPIVEDATFMLLDFQVPIMNMGDGIHAHGLVSMEDIIPSCGSPKQRHNWVEPWNGK